MRLGTLVFCEALRPASVLAKALATLDRVSGGRLDVGLGAGWYEPEYDAIGMAMPSPGLRSSVSPKRSTVVKGLLGDAPFTFDGEHHRAADAPSLPPAAAAAAAARVRRRQGRPAAAARRASTPTVGTRVGRGRPTRTASASRCWSARATRVGRDPATVWRSLGLYTLCGENERDLARRFELHGGAKRRPA